MWIVLYGSELTDEEAVIFKKARTPFLILDYWNHDMSFNGVFINNADAARMAGCLLYTSSKKFVRNQRRI